MTSILWTPSPGSKGPKLLQVGPKELLSLFRLIRLFRHEEVHSYMSQLGMAKTRVSLRVDIASRRSWD